MDFLITDLNLTDGQNKNICKYIKDVVERITFKEFVEENNYYLYNFRRICYDITQYLQIILITLIYICCN
ncbi:MAG: hypothetical protein V8R64_05135 [Thomasclavelia sp.]